MSDVLTKYLVDIEEYLNNCLPKTDGLEKDVIDAMRYSLLAGGKRIRPTLLLEFCSLCGGDAAAALPFACAVEMIHTYSLIHDDLPCMDDDDTRRGRPSNHMVFGEDIALLAGDALLSLAFDTMLCEKSVCKVGAARAVRAACLLAKASGAYGMVGGQVIDLQHEGKPVDVSLLREMDSKKTGAMIVAAAKMGCTLAGSTEPQIKAAEQYAKKIGLAFQIIDDILDVTANSEEFGKPVGSDAENKKSTYVSLLGLSKSRQLAETLTEEAIDSLQLFEGDTSSLISFARSMVVRKK